MFRIWGPGIGLRTASLSGHCFLEVSSHDYRLFANAASKNASYTQTERKNQYPHDDMDC